MSPKRVLPHVLVVLVLLAASCTAQTPPDINTPPAIDRLEVLPLAAEGAPLIVIVHGRLNNSCLSVSGEQIQPGGSQVNITLQTQAASTGNCTSGDFPFEHIVSLDLRSLPTGPLTIQAGQAQAQYTPSQAAGQPTSQPSAEVPTVTPTATQTEVAAAPTSTAPPASTAAPQTDCINKAAYYDDVTIPDGTAFNPGDAFTKTWRIRNEGTCDWTDYKLVFVNGDLMKARTSNPMPATAAGKIVDLSVDMTAPAQAGSYTGYWQFQSASGETFGVGSAGTGLIWVKIGVRNTGSSQQTTTTQGSCTYEQQTDVETQVLNLINNARSQQGLKALNLNNQLSKAALNHSIDMACQDFVGHNGSDGSTWYTRITAQGLAYTSASENIYVGNPAFGGTAQGAFDWWMNSQVHRDNILNSAFTKIGIGYVYSAASTYGGYYTLVFSRP
jgi:uncharacterized protein YkwD